MDTTEATDTTFVPSTADPTMQEAWKAFLAQQQELGAQLEDPENQAWASLAILSGVVSALALGKLYSQLSENPEDAGMKLLAGRGLTAMIAGIGYVWWEVNKASRTGGSG